jgi:hypothetical protein
MKKTSLLELLIVNLATLLFVAGLVMVNVSIYQMYSTEIGLLTTGITLIVVALILNHEQTNLTG